MPDAILGGLVIPVIWLCTPIGPWWSQWNVEIPDQKQHHGFVLNGGVKCMWNVWTDGMGLYIYIYYTCIYIYMPMNMDWKEAKECTFALKGSWGNRWKQLGWCSRRSTPGRKKRWCVFLHNFILWCSLQWGKSIKSPTSVVFPGWHWGKWDFYQGSSPFKLVVNSRWSN